MDAAAPQQTPSPATGSLADYGAWVWRHRVLIALGLVVGALLGVAVLPTLLGRTASYDATIRLNVRPLNSEVVAMGGSPLPVERTSTSPSNRLLNTEVLRVVMDEMGSRAAELDAASGKPPAERLGAVAARLASTAVTGTTEVELSYTDHDPDLATELVQRYAERYATARNDQDTARFDSAITQMQADADRLKQDVDHWTRQVDRGGAAAVGARTQLAAAEGRWREREAELKHVRDRQAFLGPATVVLGPAALTKESSPPGLRTTLSLALCLGLLVGVAAAFVVDAAAPRIVTEEDVRRLTGLPMVGAVPRASRRAGLAVRDRPFSSAAESFHRVRAALERRGVGHDIHVLAVMSADAQEGRSTLAMNLAFAWARQRHSVVLLCGDLRRPAAEKLLGIQQAAGLAELLEGSGGEVVSRLVSVAESLLVLPSGTATTNPAELLTTERLHEVVKDLRRNDTLVIIDTPAARWSADATALAGVADAVVCVVRSGRSRVRSFQEMARGLARDDFRVLGTVLMGYRASPFVAYSRRPEPTDSRRPEPTEDAGSPAARRLPRVRDRQPLPPLPDARALRRDEAGADGQAPAGRPDANGQPGARYQVELRELTPQPLLAVRLRATPPELAPALGDALPEVWEYLAKQGVRPLAAPVVRFHRYSEDQIEVEAGVPVPEALPGQGRVQAGELPGGRAAATWHVGSRDTIADAYDALAAWMAERGLEPAGPPWQVGWGDPPGNGEPGGRRTEVIWPVR